MSSHGGDPTQGFVNAIYGIPSWIIIIVVLAVVAAAAAYLVLWYVKKNRSDKGFEGKSIEEVLKTRFDKYLSGPTAWKNGSYLRQSYRSIGKAVKDVRISSRETDEEAALDFIQDIDAELIDRFRDSGIISEKDAKKLKDLDIVEHRYVMVRDTGLDGFIGFYFFDKLLGRNQYHDNFLVPEFALKDAKHGNNLILDKDIQFEPVAGMYVANTMATFALLELVHYAELYERSLEAQENYFEKLNLNDAEFAKEIQKGREEAENERKRWSGIGNRHANNR